MNYKTISSATFQNLQHQFNTYGIVKKPEFFNHKTSSGLIILSLAAIISFLSAFTFRSAMEEKVTVYLQQPLDVKLAAAYFSNPAQRASLTAVLAEVYTVNNHAPLWLEDGKSSVKLDSLVAALKEAELQGLNPDTYHLTRLENLKAETGLFSDAARIAELDQLATAAYLLYASHLYNGTLTPSQLGSNWHVQPKSLELAPYLQNALQHGTIHQSLAALSNVNPAHALLKRELANLKMIARKGGWPTIAADQVLQKNNAGEAVQALKQRLMLVGMLDSTANLTPVFDRSLFQAVQKFQQRHGLPTTGQVDQLTLAALNVPVEKRIEQVILNLERMRWLPRRTGETTISVNIPDYKLRVLEQNKEVMEANVIVGKTNFATPVFEDSLESIVFRPEWNVPHQIASEEILPKLQENIDYLQKNNFEVYDSWKANAKPINAYAVNWQSVTPENFKYRIVQKANEKNSLGAVKFLFPNALNIYIHDTPSKYLFNTNKRAYSHGCIRLQHPHKLAARLLKTDASWTEAKIKEKMSLEESTKVVLKKAIKVEIMYLTAFVQDGQLQFREDIYGYDQAQLQALRN
jgi:murein L,D-transpeptidase YcbB/YkuD